MGKPTEETRKRWEDRIARWERSGQSVKEFVKVEGINDCSFYQWRKRLKSGKEQRTEKPAVSFIEIKQKNRRAKPSQSSTHHPFQSFEETVCFDIVIDSTHRVRVPPDFNADALIRLLNVLEDVK